MDRIEYLSDLAVVLRYSRTVVPRDELAEICAEAAALYAQRDLLRLALEQASTRNVPVANRSA